MESGWDATKFDAAVDCHLEQKWPKLGATADIRLCYAYLKCKPKWNAFMESQVSGNEKHSRPNGKKKKKTLIKNKTLIKEVVKELDSSSSSASASANHGKDSFYAQAGLALAVYCKAQEHQQDISFLSMMTSPEKKEIFAMKRDVMLAKMRAEKRSFESMRIDSIHSSVVVGIDNTKTTISSTHTTALDNSQTNCLTIDEDDDN
jgi:hypothetical protein